MRIIFLEEDQHGTVKCLYIFHIAMLGTFSFIMKNTLGDIIVFIATQHHPIRQVDVLAIHKEIFIQKSSLIQCFMAQQHKCTGQHIHFMLFLLIQIRQAIS